MLHSTVECSTSEYSDVLKGEFLKRLERKPEGRPSKLFHNGIVSEYSDVLKEYALSARLASS